MAQSRDRSTVKNYYANAGENRGGLVNFCELIESVDLFALSAINFE
jgi:hypothetical protein